MDYIFVRFFFFEYYSIIYSIILVLTVVTGLVLGGILVVLADFYSKWNYKAPKVKEIIFKLSHPFPKAKVEPKIEESNEPEEPTEGSGDADKKVRRRVRKE